MNENMFNDDVLLLKNVIPVLTTKTKIEVVVDGVTKIDGVTHKVLDELEALGDLTVITLSTGKKNYLKIACFTTDRDNEEHS